MLRFFVLACGGTIGTLLRYILSEYDHKFSGGGFPVNTLLINLAGSLIIGLAWGIRERLSVSPNMRLFIFMGVLGGFTTFSTFSLENFNLFREGAYRIMFLNIAIANTFGIILVFFGYVAARTLTGVLRELW
ncbi:MAG: fluoride efflux transporter CrcB [Candidatus Omnitrophota bacterium]|nr:fluoride efflux transporter CrcB [Candidatus Omnitrophota bacterium]